MSEQCLLRVRDLVTTFATQDGLVRAVDGVSFDVRRGETLCLVGESGCGKSVTARSVLRLIDPPGQMDRRSRILFEGEDLTLASESRMREIRGRDVGMIFQEPMAHLNPVYTVGDQVEETLRQHLQLSRREARERAIELFRLVEIPAPERRVGDYPHEMSGGMQQRVMIAIALSCNPKLLIADEPTTALDVTIQAQVLELLKQLRDRLQMSILMITHDMGVVAEMADQVAVMYAGHIVEIGPVGPVFESPQHPYTEALLHSVPVLGMTQEQPLHVIRGIIPSALSWPPGCRFAPRCDYVFDRCERQDPPLLQVGSQRSACWLCEHSPRVAPGVETRS